MIITTKRHGRTARDTRNLVAHLSKQMEQISRVVAVGNVPLSNADHALSYMEAMRDGSRADVAYHHITISPSVALDDAQRDDAVQRIMSALDADDHPYIVWEHSEKPRHGADVDQHFHLVLGHVGHDGKALKDSHSFAKLEAVARSLEVDFEHALTPSRRTAAVASRLVEMGREDVAQHLVIPDELPRSSMTAGQRAMAARNGVDLPSAQQAIREAWSQSDSPSAFKSALEAGGFSVTPGDKKNVWIVSLGDVEIGALDRIVKEKRAAVAVRMMGVENDKTNEAKAATPEDDPGSDPRSDEQSRPGRARDTRRRAEVAGTARSGERAPERSAVADRRSGGHAREHHAEPASHPDDPGKSGSEDRGYRLRHALAERALRKLQIGALTTLAAELRNLSRPALDRARDRLQAMRQTAVEDLQAALSVVPVSDVLRSLRARQRALEAERARLFYGSIDAVRQAERQLAEPEPQGLLNRLLGRHREWRRLRDQAQSFMSSIAAARRDIDVQMAAVSAEAAPLEREYAAAVNVAARLDQARRQRAAHDVAVADAAMQILDRDPAAARDLDRLLRMAADDVERRRRTCDEERETVDLGENSRFRPR